MRVAVGDVNRLVAHALGDGKRGEPHLDQQAHMAVAYVVYADALHARRLAPALHLMGQEVLGHGEQALVGGDVVAHLDEVRHLVAQEGGHDDRAHRLGRLGVGHGVHAVEALVRLVDAQPRALQHEVGRRERQELAAADARPVEQLEGVERERLVHDGLAEPQVLVLGPELHLAALLRAYLVDPAHWVLGEAVVALGVVEDGVELVVHRAQVRRRPGLPVGVPVLGELVLPPDDVDRPHVAHAHVPEERHELVVDDVFLGDPRVLAYARLHLGGVHLDELGERHVHGPAVKALELALPHCGLHLGGEAALRLVALRAAGVAVVALHVERAVVAILVHGHVSPPPGSTVRRRRRSERARG